MPRTSFITRALTEVPGFKQIYEVFARFLSNSYSSSGTVNDYLRGLCRIMVHFGRLPEEITGKEYVDYYYNLREREGRSCSTYKIIRSAVIQYFAFIGKTPPAAAIPRWHSPRRIVDILNFDELDAVLRSTGSDYRSKAMLTILVGSGLRKSELINLRRSDLDFGFGRIHVHLGKRDKDRLVPFDDVERKVLSAYLERSDPQEYVFESAPGRKMKAWEVDDMLQTHLKAAGVTKHITVHSLRHLFASILFWANVSIFKIQEDLGHKRLATTIGYLHKLGFDGSHVNAGALSFIYGANAKAGKPCHDS